LGRRRLNISTNDDPIQGGNMVSLHAAVLALAFSAPGNSTPGGETALIDFYADWCGPCRQMDGTVKKLSSRGYPIRQVNIDHERRFADAHRVTSIPCFVLLVDGREVARTAGVVSSAELEGMFRKAGVAPSPPTGRRARAQSPDPTRRSDEPATGHTFPSVESDQPLVDVVSGGARERSPRPARRATVDSNPAAGQATSPVNREALSARLLAASVRLKVNDGGGNSVASGTVIDAREGEALILTCGHVFRDSQGKGPIEIDLFGPGAPQGLPGKLISYDLPSDVGLVSFRPGVGVVAVRVAPLNHDIRTGDSVINIGCNHGDTPTLRASRVTAIDKYLLPPHLIVAGQPVQGRSGGGLFSGEGLVIGVCNAADPHDRDGIYAALGAIHAELDRLGLSEMCLQDADPASGNVLAATRDPVAMADQMPPARGQSSPASLVPTSDKGAPASQAMPGRQRLTPAEEATLAELRKLSDAAEVICIVRPLDDPRAKSEVIVIDRASPEFLRHVSDLRRAPARPRANAEPER
jgi:thiol-disulfide isomerase/thioredoxin